MRSDIQFLRGVAVLAVVLYHAGIVQVSNGFLGVDVFFVVSGFLITSIVLKGLDAHQFSFKVFYFRRIARLLPALFCTLLVTTVAGWLFLTDRQWDAYRDQLFGAVTFSANIVLPYQVGYFDDAAKTKPLLHIWSLSLEEQFYLCLPVLLYLTAATKRIVLLCVLLVLSLAFSQSLLFSGGDYFDFTKIDDDVWAFYLLPSRAWELLAGSVAAWYMLRHPRLGIPPALKWVALLGLVLLMMAPIDSVSLRGDAMLVVVFTTILLLGQDNWLPRNALFGSVQRVGDISYSLYLVHWPLLAFAQVAYLEKVPHSVTYSLVGASFLLALLQYRFVEQRYRQGFSSDRRGALVGGLLISAAVLALFSSPVVLNVVRGTSAADIDFAQYRRSNTGLSWRCQRVDTENPLPECQSSSTPKVAVWGDSFAMHVVPGLMENAATEGSLVQLTLSSCNPALGLAQKIGSVARGNNCNAFNQAAVTAIAGMDSVERVVISSPFGYFYRGGEPYVVQGEVVERDPELAIVALRNAVTVFEEAGKSVLLISPPPSGGFNVGECLEREATGALILGREDCRIPVSDSEWRLRSIMYGLNKVVESSNATLLTLSDLLCDDTACATTLDGVLLWRDSMHLSYEGSRKLLQDVPL
ncbi:MAG: acyltransferase family protein [Halioglobus sp.]